MGGQRCIVCRYMERYVNMYVVKSLLDPTRGVFALARRINIHYYVRLYFMDQTILSSITHMHPRN